MADPIIPIDLDDIDGIAIDDISEDGSSIVEGEMPEEAAGKRLDAAMAIAVAEVSRSRLKDLIISGQIEIGGKVVLDPSKKIKMGDLFRVVLPPALPAEPEPENIRLDIVFEDEHLIVLNKPAGLVVHPANGHWSGTLVNALLYHCGDTLSGIGGVKRPGIVHRLDKDTSGLMVVAKSDKAHKRLSEQFADHGRTGPLSRAYQAIVWGQPASKYGVIETEIGRSTKDRLKMAVVRSGGKEAITHYEVGEVFPPRGEVQASLVTCFLETGRTHQIRVHMSHIGHPLIGDPEYGTHFRTKLNRLPDEVRAVVEPFPRQALHAFHLGFVHPITEEEMEWDSDLPDDMETLIEGLRLL